MMNPNSRTLGFYRGMLAVLMSLGLLASVLVINGRGQEGTFFRPISLGVQNGEWAAALDGVREGELVIIAQETVKPGKEVRAEVVTTAFLEEQWT
jgi:hypothetical protein